MYLEINLLSVNLPELAVLHAGGMTCLLVCVKQTSSAKSLHQYRAAEHLP
jgi:hypothetical protein